MPYKDKQKSYQKVKEWRKNTKQKLIEGFDCKCCCCGLEDIPLIYDFHHLGDDKKEFTLSGKIASWTKLVEEAKKCIMVCSHCHRKIHANLIEVKTPIMFDESKITSEKNNRWGFK